MAENEKHKNQNDNLLKVILQLLGLVVFMLFELILIILFVAFQPNIESWFTKSADEIAKEKAKKESFVQWEAENKSKKEMNTFWSAADINAESDAAKKKQLEYG